MMHYPMFEPAPGELEALLSEVAMGRLITVASGDVAVGLFPFVLNRAGSIELHLNKADAQLEMLRADARCVFQVDDIVARIPSYWIDKRAATNADVYYRSATIHATARLSSEPVRLADHLERLVVHHQGGGRHETVAADSERYRHYLQRLVLVELQPERWLGKFKLGQQEPPEVRARIREALDADRQRSG